MLIPRALSEFYDGAMLSVVNLLLKLNSLGGLLDSYLTFFSVGPIEDDDGGASGVFTLVENSDTVGFGGISDVYFGKLTPIGPPTGVPNNGPGLKLSPNGDLFVGGFYFVGSLLNSPLHASGCDVETEGAADVNDSTGTDGLAGVFP